MLGVSRPQRTLSHFLTGDVGSLAELMVQTSVPNLWLVSGNQALLEMANPKHSQKEMLFRHIRGLDVDDTRLVRGTLEQRVVRPELIVREEDPAARTASRAGPVPPDALVEASHDAPSGPRPGRHRLHDPPPGAGNQGKKALVRST